MPGPPPTTPKPGTEKTARSSSAFPSLPLAFPSLPPAFEPGEGVLPEPASTPKILPLPAGRPELLEEELPSNAAKLVPTLFEEAPQVNLACGRNQNVGGGSDDDKPQLGDRLEL